MKPSAGSRAKFLDRQISRAAQASERAFRDFFVIGNRESLGIADP
jgi:hypothetical protein